MHLMVPVVSPAPSASGGAHAKLAAIGTATVTKSQQRVASSAWWIVGRSSERGRGRRKEEDGKREIEEGQHRYVPPFSRNSELGTRNSELGTRNSELGTRNSELGTRNSTKRRVALGSAGSP